MADDIHQLTMAEIQRLTAQYNRDRVAATRELAAIHAGRQFGNAEVALPATDVEARARAVEMLNGYAPADLRMPPRVNREAALTVEIASLDIVISALGQKELVTRASEAAEWLIAHGKQWSDLCRAIVLTATRLRALEQKAVDIRRQLGETPPGMPMADVVGVRSVAGARWSHPDQGGYESDVLTASILKAISQKIVSEKEIKEASSA